MATDAVAVREYGMGKTQRRDAWWAGPLVTALVLGGFVVFTTFRIFYNADYELGHGARSNILPEHSYMLSPMYSPLLVVPWLPAWVSPAMLILWMPGGFRLTCYYYRKAYYRAFFLDPPACSVGEPRDEYHGETRLLLFQNLHRYFLYLALGFLVVLAIDAVHSALWPTAAGGLAFGVSVGTLVLVANLVLLSLYTFSCHSLRHLVGGRVDCFSCVAGGQMRYKLWTGASALNKNHMLYAWLSLIMVSFVDFYVWMVASGRISDYRFF